MKGSVECYKSLGLEPGASAERVRNAYLQLARFYDPERYVGGDPEKIAQAAEKRKEIEEAFREIRRFLPALKGYEEKTSDAGEQNRDFNEFVRKPPAEVSKPLMAVIICAALGALFYWSYFIYKETQIVQPPSAPVVPIEE